ncbi:MAG: 1-acyl-sn-glycerol-3-phosphate acyltransferase [Phycisphaerales bacterium]|nr:1-acyl-sn-glycerol-3-phosphate acyltransferase [Phycisphaerales bacterium]
MFRRIRSRHPGSTLPHIFFYNFCRSIAHVLFMIIYRRRRRGLENVPKHGGVLLVANHQSFFDPPLIGCSLSTRDTDFLARGGLFDFKPFAWFITSLNSTPIKQGAGDAGAMKEIIKRLNEKKAVLVFPEGSRTDDGTIQPFARGISVLLKRANCVVVPVGIAGVYDLWPRHRKLPRLFTRPIAVVYGEPLETKDLLEHGPDAAIEILQSRVEALAAQAESLR